MHNVRVTILILCVNKSEISRRLTLICSRWYVGGVKLKVIKYNNYNSLEQTTRRRGGYKYIIMNQKRIIKIIIKIDLLLKIILSSDISQTLPCFDQNYFSLRSVFLNLDK